jgi:GGDEF domain-containing protein
MSTAQLEAPARRELDGLSVGVLLCDGRGGIKAVTAHAAQLLGLSDADLARGERPVGWQLADDRGAPLPDLPVLAGQVLRNDTAATIALVVGGRRRLLLELYPVVLRGHRYALAVLRPVHTDVVRDKGLLDPVTGLPNRVLLFDRLDQALRRARVRGAKVTLVLAELYRPDDRMLTETGDQLSSGMGADHTVARYSAAAFAVVVDHLSGSGVPVARRVVALAPHPLRIGWVTSDGTHSVHDVIRKAEEEIQA